MSPHIQEAIIGGLVTGLFTAASMTIGLLIAFGSLKRMFREYPPHRHVNGRVLYPTGYAPGEVQTLKTREATAGE
jgi:hypothetical protein